MTNANISKSLTDLEKSILKRQQARWGSALEFNQVEKHIQTLYENDTKLDIPYIKNDNPNIRAALLMYHFRQNGLSSETSPKQAGYTYFRSTIDSITVGKEMLDKNDQYWRFKPTVEKNAVTHYRPIYTRSQPLRRTQTKRPGYNPRTALKQIPHTRLTTRQNHHPDREYLRGN